jgi:serine/threonine protein kinase
MAVLHHVCALLLQADNLFLDKRGRIVLADFGSACLLKRRPPPSSPAYADVSSWQDQPFVDRLQAVCANPMAWAPEIARYGRRGPVWDDDLELTLHRMYEKSDLFAVGRLMYHNVCVGEDGSFPTSDPDREHYSNDEVGFCMPLFQLTLFVMFNFD